MIGLHWSHIRRSGSLEDIKGACQVHLPFSFKMSPNQHRWPDGFPSCKHRCWYTPSMELSMVHIRLHLRTIDLHIHLFHWYTLHHRFVSLENRRYRLARSSPSLVGMQNICIRHGLSDTKHIQLHSHNVPHSQARRLHCRRIDQVYYSHRVRRSCLDGNLDIECSQRLHMMNMTNHSLYIRLLPDMFWP